MQKFNSKYFFAGIAIISILVGLVKLTVNIKTPTQAIEWEPKKVKGAKNGTVFIVVFSDFACPFCLKINPVLEEALATFPNDLKVQFKHFPLTSIHPIAIPIAEATECASDQEKFWEFHDHIFARAYEWIGVPDLDGFLTGYAGQLGLDTKAFRACLDSNIKLPIIDKNKEEGRRLFVSGTPTLLINGRRVVTKATIEEIKRLVQEEIDQNKG